MAWRRPGAKSLSWPLIVIRLSTHICVVRPRWVKYIDIQSSCYNVITLTYIEENVNNSYENTKHSSTYQWTDKKINFIKWFKKWIPQKCNFGKVLQKLLRTTSPVKIYNEYIFENRLWQPCCTRNTISNQSDSIFTHTEKEILIAE